MNEIHGFFESGDWRARKFGHVQTVTAPMRGGLRGLCLWLVAVFASPCWAFVVSAAGALPGLRFRAAPAPTAMALTSEEYKKNVENIRKARRARESARERERGRARVRESER